MYKVIKLGNETITVSVGFDGYILDGEINEQGRKYITALYSKLEEALDKIAEEFLDTYNFSWADSEEGFPKMNKSEFRQCFEFDGITILDEAKSGALCFIDNGAMGEHFFEVRFDENDEPCSVSMMG